MTDTVQSMTSTPQQWACPPQEQKQRHQLLLDLFRPIILEHIRHDNQTITVDLTSRYQHDKRLALWIARLLLMGDSDDQALANGIIESMTFNHGCHFCGVAGVHILCENFDRLSQGAIQTIENFLTSHISDWMTTDFRFHGANDNAPFDCAYILAICGEYFQKPYLVNFVKERWQEINRVLELRSNIHEFNSPTYTAVSIGSVAALANHIQDPQLQSWALQVEHVIWREQLIQFHADLGYFIGPYTRGYLDDNTAQSAMTLVTLLGGVGHVTPLDPMKMFFDPPAGTFNHNSWFFQQCSLCQLLLNIYHVPKDLAHATLMRPYPWSAKSSNEFIAMKDTPAGESSITTYAQKQWAMGSFGSRTWGGQTVPMHLLYRRRQKTSPTPTPAEHLESIRSVFTRMYVDSDFAGLPNRDLSIDKELSLDHGSAFTVQHQGTAILANVPHSEVIDCRIIRSSVVFPMHQSEPDEIWHGHDQLAGFAGSYGQCNWTMIRDGDVYMAFHPVYSRLDDAMIAVQQYARHEQYGLINIYNRSSFEGKTMSLKQVRQLCSGFIIEIASADEAGSFTDFKQRIMQSHIQQFQYGAEWWLRYERDDIDLELRIDTQQLNLRRAAAQGKLICSSTCLQTTPPLPLTF